MFCPNCGTRCDDNARFCGNCGTQLPRTAIQNAAPQSAPAQSSAGSAAEGDAAESRGRFRDLLGKLGLFSGRREQPESTAARNHGSAAKDARCEGVIFTNIAALAARFDPQGSCRSELMQAIAGLLEEYAELSRQSGIFYHVIDAGNYRFLNPAAGGDYRVSLTAGDSWEVYSSILADYYRFGRRTEKDETNYLFIIGGDDVVPMPVVPQYMPVRHDDDEKDIDTDIPYAYLLGERTQALFESGRLFNYEQYFHVGRLPLPTDARAEDLHDYLQRSVEAMDGISVSKYFGIANMKWGDDSVRVCEPLRNAGLASAAAPYEGSTAGGYLAANGGLFYSQPVSESNIDSVFDDSAGLYYFNLHGSSVPTQAMFYGEDHNTTCATISPRHMAAAKAPNCLVTEACYGGRFKNNPKRYSMLLSAMSNRTLLYLGSSRAAWCNNKYPIDNSDLLTTVFISAMLEGVPAGEALYLGRQAFFQIGDGHLYDQQRVTIVEFNIFGDPWLSLRVNGRPKAGKSAGEVCVMTKNAVSTVSERKCLYDKHQQQNGGSLLDMVRGAVDQNLMRIRTVIDREVYARLGVEPRKLTFIHRNSYADGKSFYTFTYDGGSTEHTDLHTVIADMNGNIKTIVSSK